MINKESNTNSNYKWFVWRRWRNDRSIHRLLQSRWIIVGASVSVGALGFGGGKQETNLLNEEKYKDIEYLKKDIGDWISKESLLKLYLKVVEAYKKGNLLIFDF